MNRFRSMITVEPAGLLLMTGSYLASTASRTLSLEKACRVNLNLSDAICDAVRNQDTDNAENERIVQEYVARLIAYRSIITSVLPCILLVFAGGWMDVTGRRKIIIFLSIIGETFVQINNIINVVFFNQLRVQYLIFLEAFFSSISGGLGLLFLALYSYITDITTEEDRTWRLGLVNFFVYVGMPIGISLSGLLLRNFGYLTVFIIALTLSVVNVCYLTFFLADPERTEENKKHDNRGFLYFLKTFFNPSHFLNSLRVMFKKTADNRALRLCVLVASTCFLFGPSNGEAAIIYMYTRYRFGWDEVQYSVFQTYSNVIGMIGTAFAFIVISLKFGWHDSVLGIASTTSKVLSSLVYCFAATATLFYIGGAVDMFNGIGVMAIRSILSKIVESNEIAKMNSIVGICEVLMPLGFVPLYTTVYTATMEFMPGFFFLLGTFLTLPPLLMFIWLLYRHLKAVQEVPSSDSSVEPLQTYI